LEEKKRYLEHHWILAQKELDQEKVLRAKLEAEVQTEHQEALKDEKARYNKCVEDHEADIKELKKSHEKQCGELGREILKHKLEADRLFNELQTIGSKVPRMALFSDQKAEKTNFIGKISTFFITIIIGIAAVCVTMAHQADLFTRSGICAPVMPGTVLDSATYDTIFQSPWWAPESYKQQAFQTFCVDDTATQPVSVEWTKDGKMHKFVVTIGGQVKMKRKAVKTEVLSDRVRVWRKNGLAEEETLTWY
jgi:hypothetical protein